MGSQLPAWKSDVFDDRLRELLEARCDLIQAPHDGLAVEAHAWLGFAIAVESSSLEDAVDLSIGYLQRGPGSSPALWYCGVLQCLERLAQIDSPAAIDAVDAILRDRTTWPLAPAVLRGPLPRVGRPPDRPAEG